MIPDKFRLDGKAALIIAKILASELGKYNIRVNVLTHKATRTRMTSPALDAEDSAIKKV